jgi:diadenosine tetraphosphate (Ap4A) HIT family hydrolase
MEESITIPANQSGRLWSDDPRTWQNLCTAAECPICDRLEAGDDQNVLAATELVIVTGEPDATLPGYVCVTSRHHVIEPYELSLDSQAEFFLDAMSVARGLARATQPVKMNYEIHGNTIPHLHMHLFPRQPGDAYVGYVITSRVWFNRTSAELQVMGEAIRQELSSRGRLVAWP